MPRRIAMGILLTYLAISHAYAQAATVFYVAPGGNDQWSGTLAAPNAGRTDGPFATITRARDAIRSLKARAGALPQPVTVQLRGGTYYLSEPFVLTPQDSGTAQSAITYQAYGGEKPVLSGGEKISGWSATTVNGKAAWSTRVAIEGDTGRFAKRPYFHQLFVNGERRARPRLPKTGRFRFADLTVNPRSTRWDQGQNQAYYSGSDIRSWRNLGDVEVVALHWWVESRLPLAAVDEARHLATFGKSSVFRLTDEQDPTPLARFYVENVFEALDTPGEWYLDRPSATLYYLPKPGEEPASAQVVAPRLSQVVRFEGDPNNRRYVERVEMQGLTFAHTEWELPAKVAGYKQAAVGVPGAIVWRGARNCALRNCEVAHIGTYAVDIGPGCQANEVVANSMTDLGAGGVKLGKGSSATTVADNRIYDGGRIFASAVGVWVGDCGNNTIAHNEIHDLYYTGISVGWRWGYLPSLGAGNIIEGNHIYNIGRGLLDDLGGIYTLGISPGTVLRGNLIHDCTSNTGRARGIYLDQGSSQIVVENNVVYRVDDSAFLINYGRDNIIRNNIFAFGKNSQMRRGHAEDFRAFTFERNIFYFADGQLMAGKWGDGQYAFDYNLYYDARGLPVTFGGMSFGEWQASGQDFHGVVADPQFANAAAGNFTLAPTSPALTLGFRPVDLSRVGPR